MKRIALTVLLLLGVGFFVYKNGPSHDLPPVPEVSPQLCLTRATQLASFSCAFDPRGELTQADREWEEQLARQVYRSLPLMDGAVLEESVRLFSSKILGRDVDPAQVIDVNASGMRIADTVKGHAISHSSDSVFFILGEHGSRELVVKAFVKVNQRKSLFMPQLAALNVLEGLDLQESDPMRPVALARCNAHGIPCALLAMGVSPGQMISEILREVSCQPQNSTERLAALVTAKKAVAALARALAELHSIGDRQQATLTENDGYVQDIRKLAKLIGPVFAKEEGVPAAAFFNRVEEMLREAMAHEVPLSYVHGGMNLKNALYDRVRDRVTLIDTVYMQRSIDRYGRPAGFGLTDYTKFTTELMAIDPQVFSQQESEALVSNFSDVYLKSVSLPPALVQLAEMRNHMREMEAYCQSGSWEQLYRRGHGYFKLLTVDN